MSKLPSRNCRIITVYIFCFIYFFIFSRTFLPLVAQAQTTNGLSAQKTIKNPSVEQIFSKHYLLVSISRNYPAAYTSLQFGPSVPHPILSYRYILLDKWSLGISANFKFMNNLSTGDDLVYASLSQESAYIYNISHPLYALIGGKYHYLYPAKKGMLPLQRHPDHELDIGVAIWGSLLWRYSKSKLIELRIERWRGTKNMKIHAYESSLGVGINF